MGKGLSSSMFDIYGVVFCVNLLSHFHSKFCRLDALPFSFRQCGGVMSVYPKFPTKTEQRGHLN